jgi:hypothetical protein
VAGNALARLRSADPDARRGAAAWLAENAPDGADLQKEVSGVLADMLGDPTRGMDLLAIRALKLWATEDSLPKLAAFAKAGGRAVACPPELIDVLARFPGDAAAQAIALQLEAPEGRDRAVKALLRMGATGSKAALPYLDHPDTAVRTAARQLAQKLDTPPTHRIDQALADLGDARKGRVRAALALLARLRPDEAARPRVSAALNAPLLDAAPDIRSAALDAVAVWGTKANTATLLKLLAQPRIGGRRDTRIIAILGTLQDATAAPTLAEGLTRPEELDAAVKALVAIGPGAEDAVTPYLRSISREARFAACWILGEIGTARSMPALDAAGTRFNDDPDFTARTQLAAEKITGRG